MQSYSGDDKKSGGAGESKTNKADEMEDLKKKLEKVRELKKEIKDLNSVLAYSKEDPTSLTYDDKIKLISSIIAKKNELISLN